MAKRYYWLKLPEDFFRQKAIKKLRRIAGGDHERGGWGRGDELLQG